MNNLKDSLTEFEGALLAAIRRSGEATPYQIRQAFETSPSPEWSGSSGSVYPAINRLVSRNLLAERRSVDDRRGTKWISLTELGESALLDWIVDIDAAVGPGLDPFRTRSSEWQELPAAKRRTFLKKLECALTERISELGTAMVDDCGASKTRIALDLELQRTRRKWLRNLKYQ